MRNNDFNKDRNFLPTVKLQDDPVFAKIPKTGSYNKNFSVCILRQILQKCQELRDDPIRLHAALTTSVSRLLDMLQKDPSK